MVSPRAYCALCEIAITPEYQAASSVENSFPLLPRRLMALLEYICNGVESAAQSPWVEICATTKTAWENNFGTVSKMQVAAVELENDDGGHEMSNQ